MIDQRGDALATTPPRVLIVSEHASRGSAARLACPGIISASSAAAGSKPGSSFTSGRRMSCLPYCPTTRGECISYPIRGSTNSLGS